MTELKKIQDLLDIFKTINGIKFDVICNRDSDDYHIRILLFTEENNDEAMLIIRKNILIMNFIIHIDSIKFFETYNNLKEDEKIPPQHNIINPCIEDNYMSYMVKWKFLEIMKNLKMFNGIKDDYISIAKLARIARGYVLCKPFEF
ncbi:MAG: hypothetical protein NTZ33_05130 [Bacteroidetes bacterium]|nr:hypothetical protein [Bacteroidota bacterium]